MAASSSVALTSSSDQEDEKNDFLAWLDEQKDYVIELLEDFWLCTSKGTQSEAELYPIFKIFQYESGYAAWQIAYWGLSNQKKLARTAELVQKQTKEVGAVVIVTSTGSRSGRYVYGTR